MRTFHFLLLAALCAASSTAYAQWHTHEETDAFTDQTRSFAYTFVGDSALDIKRITVRCADNKLEVIVGYEGEYLGSGRLGVRYRLDDGEPQTQRWTAGTTGKAVFSPSPAAFAKGLANSNRLVFEATDFRGVRHQAIFGLGGSAKAIALPMSRCNIQ